MVTFLKKGSDRTNVFNTALPLIFQYLVLDIYPDPSSPAQLHCHLASKLRLLQTVLH